MLLLRQLKWQRTSSRLGLLGRCTQFTAPRRTFSAFPLDSLPTLVQSCEHQIFQSLSTDPFVNLAIEQLLFETSPDGAKILFLYVNRPCVVIGRNQNPWLEANLDLLSEKVQGRPVERNRKSRHEFLLRRRSGGGAVYHDEGNLNYCVICPKPMFNRDKHAEMVVRALKGVGALQTRVNERHDIVLGRNDQIPTNVVQVDSDDLESPQLKMTPNSLKISGSAYKLTGMRAMHHGTCLIDSRDLALLGSYLRSPLRPYIKARGVDSVRSPVGNVSSVIAWDQRLYLMQRLVGQVMEEFAKLYDVDSEGLRLAQGLHKNGQGMYTNNHAVVGAIDDSIIDDVGIRKRVNTLKSLDWKYDHSPQFTFSTYPTPEDPRPRPVIPPEELSPSVCDIDIIPLSRFRQSLFSCIANALLSRTNRPVSSFVLNMA